jgi:acyl carrier protein
MTNKEKINLIEDALEIELNTLKVETILSEIPEYDSMAKLSLIVLCDEEFGKKLLGERIRGFQTIGDILSFIEE